MLNIESLRIERYGVHERLSIDGLGRLTLIFGPNEAGKSTLMSFLRFMLFGAAGNAAEHAVSGAAEGSLVLVDPSGRRWRLARRREPAEGSRARKAAAQLVREDGHAADAELVRVWLGGLTPSLYRNLFAFSLRELQEFSALDDEQTGAYLFNAGLGVAPGAVLAAERRLAQEMERLFRPRGQQPQLNRAMAERERTDKELRLAMDKLDEYRDASRRLNALEQELKRLEAEIADRRREAEWLAACRDAWPHWIRRAEIVRELSELPDVSAFPADAALRFEQLRSRRDEWEARLRSAESQLGEIRRRWEDAAAFPERAFAPHAEALEELWRQWPAHQGRVQAAASRRAELAALQEQFAQLLARISPAWRSSDLERFPMSMAERERAERLAAELCEARREALEAGQSVRHWEERLREAEGRLAGHEREGRLARQRCAERCGLPDGFDPAAALAEAARLSDDLRRWKETDDQRERARERLHDAAEAEHRAGWAAPAAEETHLPAGRRLRSARSRHRVRGGERAFLRRLALPGAAALLLPLYPLWHGDWAAASAAFVLCAVWLLYAALRRGRPPEPAASESEKPIALRERLRWLEEECERREAEIASRLAALFPAAAASEAGKPARAEDSPGEHPQGWRAAFAARREASAARHETGAAAALRMSSPLRESWEAIVRHVGAAEAELRRFQAEQAVREREEAEWSAAVSRCAAELDKARRTAQERGAIAEQLHGRWQRWLAEYRLPADLPPESLPRLAELVERAQELARQCRALERLIGDDERETSDFAARVSALLAELPLEERTGEMERDLRSAREAARRALRREEERRHEMARGEELEREAAEARAKLTGLDGQIRQLLHAAGADDDESFRRRAAQAERALRLNEQLRQLEAMLAHLAGTRGVAAMASELSGRGEEQLAEAWAEASRQVERLRMEADRLREDKGRLAGELARLTSDEEHARLLQLREEREEEVRALTAQWAKRALALHLIRATRARAEQERQPRTMIRAGEYFAAMTGGRYTRVVSRLSDRSVAAVRRDGEWVEPSRLSRGTAEQLFLSIRFALAHEYAQHASVPIMMDDIFVHFDSERLRRALLLLPSLAERHQVLLFTCHEHVRDEVRRLLPSARLIELES